MPDACQYTRRLILLLIPLCLACAAPRAERPVTIWEDGQALVTLYYRGDAEWVAVAGEFNNWNPERSLFVKTSGNNWACELRLEPGQYRYLLAVETDNSLEWRPDGSNPRRERDARGRELSLLIVPRPGEAP